MIPDSNAKVVGSGIAVKATEEPNVALVSNGKPEPAPPKEKEGV